MQSSQNNQLISNYEMFLEDSSEEENVFYEQQALLLKQSKHFRNRAGSNRSVIEQYSHHKEYRRQAIGRIQEESKLNYAMSHL